MRNRRHRTRATVRTLARVALVGIAVAEALGARARFRDRTRLYRAAVARARALGRPLVVVGDPDTGAHTRLARAAGCGDVCVDLTGCPGCPVGRALDITRPTGFASDSAVVFVSCVLEYVGDPSAALAELLRIAGSAENLFVATVQPWTLTAVLYPGARQVVETPTRGAPAIRSVGTLRKVATVGALGAIGVLAW